MTYRNVPFLIELSSKFSSFKVTLFWDITQFSQVDRYRSFEETCLPHHTPWSSAPAYDRQNSDLENALIHAKDPKHSHSGEFSTFQHRSGQPALPQSVYTLTCTHGMNLSPAGTVANRPPTEFVAAASYYPSRNTTSLAIFQAWSGWELRQVRP